LEQALSWRNEFESGGLFHERRKVVFVRDLVDRGPKIPQVLKLVMNDVASDAALCVPGNHDVKLMRKLPGICRTGPCASDEARNLYG